MSTTKKIIRTLFLPRLKGYLFKNLSHIPESKPPFSTLVMARNLKIAIIGQSVFATDVYNLIRKNGHTVVGVFTIPDKNGREVIDIS